MYDFALLFAIVTIALTLGICIVADSKAIAAATDRQRSIDRETGRRK